MIPFFTSRVLVALCHRVGVAGLALLALLSSVIAQQAPQYPQNLTPENLRLLLAPIALYPDALIALILPASTTPSDVVLASRFIASDGDPLQIPNQSWDNSVQSLASYPEVISWMDQNLEWTTSLGQAFIIQPKDVMSAIQQLRFQAETAGNLVTTPQQIVVREKTIIRIVPAEPEYLYVPQYDPEIVYVQPYSQDFGPVLTFGIGFAVGAWLNYDCDWNRQQIYRGDWQPGWDYGRYGRGGNRGYDGGGDNIVNVVNINESTAQAWQPSDRSRQQVERQQRNFNRSAVNAQTSTDVSAATMNQSDRNSRNVPRPSRAEFGKRGSGNRNAVAPTRNATPAPAAQPAGETTTPPDVAGQQGKPPRGEKKRDQNQANTASPTVTPPQVAPNAAPNQIGGAPGPGPSKKEQRAARAAVTDRMPPPQAPVLNQDGRAPVVATDPMPPKPEGKRNGNLRTNLPPPPSTAPVVQDQPANPSREKKPDRKNTSKERPKTPAPQNAQTSQPQQNTPPPSRPKPERKEQKSAPQQQQRKPQLEPPRPQAQQQQQLEQRPQPQKPPAQAQKPRQQEQKQQKQQQQQKKSAPPQNEPDKKSDKKDKKD